MNCLRSSFFIVLVLVLVGCSPRSINPLVDLKDSIREPGLEGVWRWSNDDGDSFDAHITQAATGYSVKIIKTAGKSDQGHEWRLAAALIKINGVLMADLSAHPVEVDRADQTSGPYLLPVHQFARIELSGETLSVAPLDPEWLDELLRADENALAHVHCGNDEVLISAPSTEIRGFFEKHATDDKAFDDPMVWTRRKVQPEPGAK